MMISFFRKNETWSHCISIIMINVIMGLLITTDHFDLLKFKNFTVHFWQFNDFRQYHHAWECRFVDNSNNLINEMKLSRTYHTVTIRDQNCVNLDDNQYELLDALCNGMYWIIRCQSSTYGCFDVAFTHPCSITFNK